MSRLTDKDLEILCDKATTSNSQTLKGLVNVNTASAAVLAALPGMSEAAQRVVEARGSDVSSNISWLYTQGVLDADKFKQVAPYLTASSYQFRIQCVGYGVPCGRFRVLEAVVDLSGPTPQILYQRDRTRLGLPFSLNAGKEEQVK